MLSFCNILSNSANREKRREEEVGGEASKRPTWLVDVVSFSVVYLRITS
jgi:hypothetical protein